MTDPLKSTWVWTGVLYIIFLLAVAGALLQNGINPFSNDVRVTALVTLVVMLYPAWRIGAIGARFFRRRRNGEEAPPPKRSFSTRSLGSPNSLEARMDARRKRVEKARQEGKL